MARYIDADKLKEAISHITVTVMGGRSYGKTIFGRALNSYREEVLKRIEDAPTANVVPKSEVDYWKEQCFHACMNNGCLDTIITRLVENAEGHNDPIGEDGAKGEDGQGDLNPLYRMPKAEVARENFEEIEKHGRKMQSSDFSGDFWDIAVLMSDIAELKKKYTE